MQQKFVLLHCECNRRFIKGLQPFVAYTTESSLGVVAQGWDLTNVRALLWGSALGLRPEARIGLTSENPMLVLKRRIIQRFREGALVDAGR